MAKRKKATTAEGYPKILLHKGVTAAFEMVCPITGDLIYSGHGSKEQPVNLLIPNPNAVENQLRYFSRNGRRG